MYWVGYTITFLILFSCERQSLFYSRYGIRAEFLRYLDDMGFTKPFACARGNPFSAAIQALWWPWPFIWLAVMIVFTPFILIYYFFKEK